MIIMKKTHALILAAVLVIALLGLYGCHPAVPQATEPTATTDVTETTAVTEATKAPTEAPTEPAETEVPTEAPTVPEETDAPTLPAEVNRPQGGASQPGTPGSSNGQQTGSAGTGSSKPSGSTGSGSGAQQPPVTPPPATQPPVTVPPATQPPVTEPPATEHTHYYVVTSTIPATCTQDGSVTYTCDVCWDSYTEAIPAAHVWVHHHEDEAGHYEGYATCKCGYRCQGPDDWFAHRDSFSLEDALYYHTSYAVGENWVVDTPAQDWNECSVCGAIK